MKCLSLTIALFLFSIVSYAAIGPITGNTTVCVGRCTLLSNATPGGTWSTSSPMIATLSPSGLYCGNSPGTAIITYSTSSGSATINVTVNQSPGPIIGSSMICTGTTVSLSNSVAGGSWSSSGIGFSIDASTGVVTPTASSGGGNVFYTLPSGCLTSTTVYVVASPCASGITVIPTSTRIGCGSDTVSVPFYYCANYQWQQSPDNVIWTNISASGSNSQTYIFTPTSTYYYRCAISCAGGGTIYSSSALINIASNALHASISNIPDTACATVKISVKACGSPGSYNVTTFFGDGSSNNDVLTGTTPSAVVQHAYAMAGTYTITQILYNGTTPVDTITYPYEYLYCRTLPLKFYVDNNSNCTYDAGETINTLPIQIEVDSNGTAIDTLSATSGLYYKAYGPPGTVYGFKMISNVGAYPCIPSGIITQTIVSYMNTYPVQYYGLVCPPSTAFDLAASVSTRSSIIQSNGTIYVRNLRCLPQAGTLTLNFSPKYIFHYGGPTPASITATSATWNTSTLSSLGYGYNICYSLNPALPLTIGDTANITVTFNPLAGDADISNNVIVKTDTITGSFDPNYVETNPKGHILHGAQLEYTIHFENTGTDTAHNISVMDTLDANLLPGTMEITAASHVMNAMVYNDGVRNIIKFDYPNIMLPDSSHHGLADGFVTYKINSKSGLADGTPIYKHAGIFFDTNPVVLTNTTENDVAYINGPNSVCAGSTITLTELATGGTWASSSSNATVSATGVVTGVATGTATISYTRIYGNGPVTVTKAITIGAPASAGTITGLSSVCTGLTISLSNATPGGVWSAGSGVTVSTGGVVTGTIAGTSVISYSVTSSCGTSVTTHTVTVNAAPDAGIIMGSSGVCPGATITLTDVSTGGIWSISNANATISGAVVTGVTAGTATVSYSVTNACGTNVTTHGITINPLPNAGSLSGASAVCAGNSITVNTTVLGGVWSVFNGNAAVTGGVVTGNTAGTDTIYYAITNLCGTATAKHVITINPQPNAGSISGPDEVCLGSNVLLTESATGGAWSSFNGNISVSGGMAVGVTAGTDSVFYTVTNSCGTKKAAKLISVIVCPTAVNTTTKDNSIILYPNPTNGELTVIIQNGSFSSYTITNVGGQEMITRAVAAAQTNIDISAYAPGIYYITLKGDSGNVVKKIVKQ